MVKTTQSQLSTRRNKALALGKALAKARHQAGLTQQQLCLKTEIAYSTLTKIERGAIKQPNVFTVFKIAQATNTSLEDLINQAQGSYIGDRQVVNSVKQTAKSGVKFVFFDIHQTLINSSYSMVPLIAAQFNLDVEALKSLLLKYDHRLCRNQLTTQDFSALVCQKFGIKGLDWQELYLKMATADKNVIKACLWVMKHYRVGILTNAFPGNCQALIESEIIPKGFEIIVDSSEIGLLKPEKAIYEYAQEKVQLPASQIMLVDDRQINITMAEVYGWQGYIIKAGNTVDTLKDLQTLLEF